ncbi:MULTISPECIES: FecR family protein [unclassified Arcicella]|uniref:FecR family protein n=1 Tax=unclassified Arcicella TaxID=2644986 RepID=UPI0028548574|nr:MULTISPECIES: FecR family protein [unclassified Arcicella]MDR6562339.1 ferric-dicitrate binding protein FerR (iron transport regulator) [Arcicella sp. BE51]MDR6812233.1 ferric-dicitrate binding protein FerR (iron transport regulator) [Arcicella sp. BE140]MDR6823564.1 ferric-dicitrate binding protein FerR (iron transport regulator) [Arcicella sp. BE139]
MGDSKLIILIEKYQQGICTVAEKRIVEEWMDSLATEQNSFENIKEAEKLAIKQRMFSKIKQEIAVSPRKSIRFFNLANYVKIAAVLAILIGLFALGPIGYDVFDLKNETIVASSDGQTKKLMLSDGSIIWLKGKSTLTYPEHFDKQNREVSLNGEALFEVAKDANHPFIVHSGQMDTRVLGTSFNIRHIGGHIEVVVFTGKVTVSLPNTNKQMLILPLEKAICMPAEKEIKAQVNVQKEEYLANTEYNMNFEDAKMSDIIKKIEAKFDVTVKLTDNNLQNCLITADFTDQSLVKTFEVLCQTLNGTFERENNTVWLKAEGCN